MHWGMMATGPFGSWSSVVGEEGWRKGPWTAEEDRLLIEYVRLYGEGRWNSVARLAGLKRNGKSCRLRWVNYLRPDLKRGQITPHEESIILELHARWGNRWSTIARSLPGRTDNEIKNYWRTHFKKKAKVPSDCNEKTKTRLLTRRQFHHQQRQQLQQQHKQQLEQFNQLDMKGIIALLDDDDDEEEHKAQPCFVPPQVIKPTLGMSTYDSYPNVSGQEGEGMFPTTLNNNAQVPADVLNNEDMFLWDGLWTSDDFHGDFRASLCIQ